MALPKWKCHKIVEAAPILKIEVTGDGALLHLDAPVPTTPAPKAMFARYSPVPGDYYGFIPFTHVIFFGG